eukprot:TRINITY_DN1632_c0_g2_i1.p1 TRINITY_DN1632_c0_g2~~TRINITY_DN1632_c0_g2_i1.p1  ORF type:complete len:1120 (+),score=296.43 TRINITY_DN1632_c0_g2_i1:194-3361(+)
MTLETDELIASLTRRRGGVRTAASNGNAGAASAAPAAASKGEKKEKEKKPVKEKPKWGEPGSSKAKKEKPKKETKEEVFVPTPEGEKKDMTLPLAEGYNPAHVESAWGAWWEKKGFFTPDAKKVKGTADSKKFIMVIPPPNVTGSLHLGHTLTGAIEDALTRWHRMCGNVALWVPGTDHAGIATQSVVERLLYKNEGLTRHDLGREKFLERVWDWKAKNGARICTQMRRIAASVDWTRERFTMDKMLGRAVEEAFIRFHEQGLIYRDNRLVNWCPHLRTALSDLEVDHEDIPGKTLLTIPGYSGKVEVGVLCEFKYMIKGTKDSLTVATTRLETMLGDTGVSVHPDDERYKKFHGKELEHPFYPDRKMIVVADPMVDKEFGTGCVKITPAHDRNDFACGQRHGLAQINVFSEDGNINELGGQFKGQHRFEARKTVEEALKEKGLWVGKKSHAMRLGLCSRSKDIIEPYLKPQWWMNCKDLADKSVNALRQGDLKIVPEFHHQTWYHWLENIQDWCISRQLWWGHRIPAYKVVKPVQAEEKWFTGRSAEEAAKKAEAALGVKGVEVAQDEDVLDTWFSSGLFPFSVFGWPDIKDNDDFDAFFPTSLLETGHDILFFWVARMVMMSIGLTGKLPFHTIYLHAMVRDAHGRKMSKSLGNVIDPLEVIDGISLKELQQKLHEGNLPEKEIEKAKKGQEVDFPDGIPQCGADALRFGLLAYTLQGRNVNLDINRVVGYRHFCNKVWNASRFGLMYFGSDYKFSGALRLDAELAWEDKWILSKLSACAQKTNQAFEKYEFANATTATYSFFLYELCDVYLELLKPRFHGEAADAAAEEDRKVARDVLYVCLDQSMRLMHPLLPYLTEELYQRLPPSPIKAESITIAPFPTQVVGWNNHVVEDEMEVTSEIAKRFRSQKTSLNLAPSSRPQGFVRHSDPEITASLKKLTSQIARMGSFGEITVLGSDDKDPAGTLRDVVSDKCIILTSVVGLDLSQELTKLEKKMTAAQKMVASWDAKMSVPNYEEKVPAAVREQNSQKKEACQVEFQELQRAVEGIKNAMK